MLGIPYTIAASLDLALLLNQNLRGILVYRTLLYLPSFTAGVALMILWKTLYNPAYGPINVAINAVLDILPIDAGLTPRRLASMDNLAGLQPESLTPSSRFFGIGARDALIIMGIWTVAGGNSMLLNLAALTNVPEELHEAASLDGAGQWQAFWHVTWPQLAPTTFFIVLTSLIARGNQSRPSSWWRHGLLIVLALTTLTPLLRIGPQQLQAADGGRTGKPRAHALAAGELRTGLHADRHWPVRLQQHFRRGVGDIYTCLTSAMAAFALD